MTTSDKVFHNTCAQLRKKLHVILVRPERGGNIGSTARALANMGVSGTFTIVGEKTLINSECIKFAKHARDRIENAVFTTSLKEALEAIPSPKLSLASTARVGSSTRPHPVDVRTAVERGITKLKAESIEHLVFVFGCESDGLSNEDVALCDWVVTIPSSEEYRSLNLSQSVLIFCHEANTCLNVENAPLENPKPSQKQKFVRHLLEVVEESGFILPGDPFKMRPKLEGIFDAIPNHVKEAKTLHGLLDQVSRSMKEGRPAIRGRYLVKFEKMNGAQNGEQ